MRQFLSFQNLSFRACLFTARVTILSTSIAWRERLKGIHPFLISVEDRANISQLPQFRFAPILAVFTFSSFHPSYERPLRSVKSREFSIIPNSLLHLHILTQKKAESAWVSRRRRRRRTVASPPLIPDENG